MTRDNITVIIPNSNVASSEVINLTSKNFIRFDIRVRIAFEDDIATARKEILQVLTDTEVILSRPEHSATVAEIGEYGVFFIVRFWVNLLLLLACPLLKRTKKTSNVPFDNAGVSTPYPHMRLLMPSETDHPIATKSFTAATSMVSDGVPLTKNDH